MNQFRIWWADSRGKVIAVLLALWAGALLFTFHTEYMWMPAFTVLLCVAFDAVISFIRKRRMVITMSSFVTGLLIGLIFDPTTGVLPLGIACLVAVIGKQCIGAGDHRHIFNPATLGIVVSSILFNRGDAWWGATWGIGAVIIIAAGMILVLHKLRRLWMPITFLLVYFINSWIFVSLNSAVHLVFDGTVFLFAFIMLPEPISSVSGSFWRYVWGLLVGIFVIVQSAFHIYIVDILLMALLAANFVGFLFVRLPFIRRSSAQTV